jgi:hypothetical protein
MFATPAFAHAIRMKVEITDSQVQATVRYDGADEDGGPVEVQLSRRDPPQEIAKVKPGPEAVATFPRPEPGLYRMIAQDEFCHRVVVDFEVPPLGQNATVSSQTHSQWLTVAGVAIVAVVAFVWWRISGRKKHHGP